MTTESDRDAAVQLRNAWEDSNGAYALEQHPHEIAYDALMAAGLRLTADEYAAAHQGDCCKPVTVTDAALEVAADQRASYPDMTITEAVAHARDTLGLVDVITHTDWTDADSNRVGAAYLIVLAAPESVVEL